MGVPNKILVAVDLSVYSPEVLKYSAGLAERLDAELILANIINKRDIDAYKETARGISSFSVDEFISHREKDRHHAMGELIEGTSCGHLPIKRIVGKGVPFRALIGLVNEENADLVVMGTKGRGNLSNVLFGSTAEKVFRHCPVPVLSIRHNRQKEKE